MLHGANGANKDALASIDETCRRLSIHRATVYRLIEAGELEAVKIGAARRVRVSSIERVIERGTGEAA